MVNAIMMSIGDQKSAGHDLHRELYSVREEVWRNRRILRRELADVGDHGETIGTIDAVDAVNAIAADERIDQALQDIRRVADECHIVGATKAGDGGQTAGEGEDRAGLRIDAQDATGEFRDIERTIQARP